MTTDFRALCAELSDALRNAIRVVYHEDGTQHISTAMPILRRARAALAEEPAAPTVMEIIELSSEIETAGLGQVDFARAVLARWGNPALQPPAEGEVAELVAWLREQADHELGSTFDADYFSEDPAARNLNRAADLLQRLSPSQPVPVSERLWAGG